SPAALGPVNSHARSGGACMFSAIACCRCGSELADERGLRRRGIPEHVRQDNAHTHSCCSAPVALLPRVGLAGTVALLLHGVAPNPRQREYRYEKRLGSRTMTAVITATLNPS